jgi:4-hydroxybenzoate polyprenyltransferase
MGTVLFFIKSLRFKQQWVKNLFIFAPMIFALHFFQPDYLRDSFIAFVLFGFVTGAIYVINDCIDKNSDSFHPTKRHRPIASGKLKIRPALIGVALLLLADLFFIFQFNRDFFLISILYIVLNIFYSLYFKKVVILDVMIIAFGFVLRVLIGGVINSILLSPWILIMTFLISIFLGLVKRRQELVKLNLTSLPDDHQLAARKTLHQYNIPLLDQLISVTTATTLISYTMYVVNPVTQSKFNTENLFFTIPFVLFGIFRYLYLIYSKDKGESPEEIIFSDLPFSLNILLWVIVFLLVIYF